MLNNMEALSHMPVSKPPYPESDINTILASVIERLEGGESLNKICSDDDMPNRATVMKWLKERPDLAEQYAYAREEGAENLVDRVQSITDEVLSGAITPEQGRVVIHSLQWLIMKMKPQKYGDKPSSTVINNMTDNRKIDVAFETLKLASKDVLEAAKKQITHALDTSSDNDEK